MTHTACYMSIRDMLKYARKNDDDREPAESRRESVDTGKTLLHDLLNKPDWVRDSDSYRLWRMPAPL